MEKVLEEAERKRNTPVEIGINGGNGGKDVYLLSSAALITKIKIIQRQMDSKKRNTISLLYGRFSKNIERKNQDRRKLTITRRIEIGSNSRWKEDDFVSFSGRNNIPDNLS
ncbi:hypothetical protein ACFX13_014773 [Malus domestica]